MRVSVPNIPATLLSSSSKGRVQLSTVDSVQKVADFIKPGNVNVITGAGVSVDSGIRAYRGPEGRYMNPNYKPIFYHELVDATEKGFQFRQRYWMRSYFGYPPVRDAEPNTTHTAIAALQYVSKNLVKNLITQNVDGLHHKSLEKFWSPEKLSRHILELHGTLFKVKCNRGHAHDRNDFQAWLAEANPKWAHYLKSTSASQIRTNPDGDVALEGVSYDDFVVPDCPSCLEEGIHNSNIKPEVVFFGESIPNTVKERALSDIDAGDRLLVIGTTLATYSAFRLLKRALERNQPVLLLNVGPTRADDQPKVEKVEIQSGLIIRDVVRSVLGPLANDAVVQSLLASGVYKPPKDDDDDRSPRAAG